MRDSAPDENISIPLKIQSYPHEKNPRHASDSYGLWESCSHCLTCLEYDK